MSGKNGKVTTQQSTDAGEPIAVTVDCSCEPAITPEHIATLLDDLRRELLGEMRALRNGITAHIDATAILQRDNWHDERARLGGMLDQLMRYLPAEAMAAAASVTPPAPLALETAPQNVPDALQAAPAAPDVSTAPARHAAVQAAHVRYLVAHGDLALAVDVATLRAWHARVADLPGKSTIWSALDGRPVQDGSTRFAAFRARRAGAGVAKLATDAPSLRWLAGPCDVDGLAVTRMVAILNRWRSDTDLLTEYDARRVEVALMAGGTS